MEYNKILEIVKEKVEALKNWEEKPNKKKYGHPDFNHTYARQVELKERMEIHTELDKKPKELMKKRGPYEDDRQYEYREKNFNNVTMPYFMKAVGKLNRIMNKSNYSIQWQQGEEQEYFKKYIPIFGSIEDYFEQIVIIEKILDPNALLVVKPLSLPVREAEVEGEIVIVFDDSKPIDPVPVIIECDDVIDYMPGVYAMIELEEKTWVEYGGRKVKEGLIFEFYDTQNIYRIKQYGKKTDWTFTAPEIYYPHQLGYLPCEKLRGIPKNDDGHIYYWSYFIYAIPLLDIAIYEYSNLDISLITQMFPQRSEWVEKCNNEGCVDGFIQKFVDDKVHLETCNRCNGTGKAQPVGVMQVKQFTVPDAMQPDDPIKSVQFPGVAYVAPPVEPLQFVYDKFQQDIKDAFGFINMEVSNSDVKGSETALGKQIDREELFAFLMRISNEVFALLSFTIKAIGEMRYGKDFEEPIVKAPTSFAIRSEYDLTEELIESKKAQIPDVAMRQIIREYIGKRFSNQKNIEQIIELAFYADRFITSNVVDMTARLANGTADKWEAILHDSIYTMIDAELKTNEKFFEQDIEVQNQILVDKAKAIAAGITQGKTETVDKILNIANNQSV